jgi:uncharacterized membrane protein
MKAEDFYYIEGRSGTADLLKGIAVIFMVQVHLMELFAIEDVYLSSFGNISLFLGGPPAAPLFMIIMGYFVVVKSKSAKQLLIRGIKLFSGGILLNIALNLNLLVSHFTGRLDYYIEPLHYVFGADILPLAGLSLIVIALMQRIFNASFVFYFILAVFVITAADYLVLIEADNSILMYLYAFLWGDYVWSYFPLFPWMAYPLTGAGFYYLNKKYTHLINTRIKSLFLLSWIIFIILTINYGVETASELDIYYHHGLYYFLWTLLFLSGSSLLFASLNRNSGNSIPLLYIKWIGQNVTLAYVFQWIIIGNIATELYRTQETADLIFWFIGIMTLVTMLIYLFRRTVGKFESLKVRKLVSLNP